MAHKKKNKKIFSLLGNSLRMLAAAALAIAILGYSLGAQFIWHKNRPQRKIVCDNGSEQVDPNTLINAYLSPQFTRNINSYIDAGATAVKMQTDGLQTGSLDAIAGADASVTSSQSIVASERVFSSSKLTNSALPLGWESDLGQTSSGHIDDYGIRFKYKSSIPVEVGVTYRKDGKITGSVVYSKLQKSSDWSEQILHFATYPPDTHPYFTISSSDLGSLSIKNLKIGLLAAKQIDSGIVSVAFDDGWESVYTHGLPLFQKYGIDTTQYIVSDFSLQKPAFKEYMDEAQLKKMQAAGHEIASHSYEHCNATEQTSAHLLESITTSQAQFNKSFGVAPKQYAHPFGAYDNRVNNILADHFSYIRSSDVGLNSSYFDPHNIRIIPVLNTTSETEIKEYALTAAEQHVWLVLLYHRIDEAGDYSVSSSMLEAQLKTLTTINGIKIMPVGKAIQVIDQAK